MTLSPLQVNPPLLLDQMDSGSLKTCRWDWCREMFIYHEELVQHVLVDHIATAKPVKRKDIQMVKRTEQGTQATNRKCID